MDTNESMIAVSLSMTMSKIIDKSAPDATILIKDPRYTALILTDLLVQSDVES